MGSQAGGRITTGERNTFVGWQAGSYNTGSGNCFFGPRAGWNIRGSGNTAIGSSSGPEYSSGEVNYRLYINNSTTTEPLIYGEFDNDLLTVHHKTANPGNKTGFRINRDRIGKRFKIESFIHPSFFIYPP